MSIQILTGQILDKMPDIGKWHKQFMLHLFSILLTFRGRHTILNVRVGIKPMPVGKFD